MEQNKTLQINISMPNLINICVDEKEHGEIGGRIYHCYDKEPMLFHNVVEMLRKRLLLEYPIKVCNILVGISMTNSMQELLVMN